MVRAYEFLFEASKETLSQNFSDKCWALYQTLPNNWKKRNIEQPDQLMDLLLSQDPDQATYKYSKWIITRFLQKDEQVANLENTTKVLPELTLFDKAKPKLPIKDINQIKSVSDLFKLLVPYQQEDLSSNKQKKQKEKDDIWKEIEIIYDGPDIGVYVPKTEKASIFLGKGTQWCTSATKTENAFNEYNKEGPLYVIFCKKEKDAEGRLVKYQFHLQSNQYMNVFDEEIDPRELFQKYPVLYQIFKSISIKINRIELLTQEDHKDLTPEIMMAAVKQNGYALEYIKDNPKLTPEIMMAAVNQDGNAIRHITDNPKLTPEIMMAAVTRDGHALEYIKDDPRLTPEIMMAAVKQRGNAIRYIAGNAVQYIKDNPKLTPEIMMAAVEQDGNAIRYIKDNPKLTSEVMMAAVTRDGYAIQYIKDNPKLTPEIMMAAVEQDGNAIRYIKDNPKLTSEIMMAAVKQNDKSIQYIKDDPRLTPEMMAAAVKQRDNAIQKYQQMIKDKSELK